VVSNNTGTITTINKYKKNDNIYIVTNSHQVFVVADADTKVRYTGVYQWRKKEEADDE
jgi:hypothetical protein